VQFLTSVRYGASAPQTTAFAAQAGRASLILAAIALLCSMSAQAQETYPSFRFSGYGTVGIAHSTEDQADFIAHDLQDKGAGLADSWSMAVDSRIGLQISAEFTPELSGVLQVVSEQRYDGTFRPEIEWLNLSYDVTPDLTVRAGRVVLDSFLVSDHRKVGYATPWVRPPVEVYSLIPLTNSDGVDVRYRSHFGDLHNTFKVGAGVASERTPDGGTVETEGLSWHFSNTLEYGPATLRFAYTRSDFSVDLDQFNDLIAGYRSFAQGAGALPFGLGAQAAAQANALADEYDPHDRRLEFFSIGGSYDPGKWFVMAEWGRTESESVFGTRDAWYATAGYRWRQFTPYITYAEAKLKSRQSDPGITATLPPLPPPFDRLNAAAGLLNAELNGALANAPIQKTVSVGVRWDFYKNAALKLQYDYSRMGDDSPGTLDHQTLEFVPGENYEVFSATIDFVF
jgi:predicted porin